MHLDTVAERVDKVRRRIEKSCRGSGRSPDEVTLVAITKGVAPWAIRQAAAAGVLDFGENRVQEAQKKRPELLRLAPHPTWHLVGHLQTNKVKIVLELFDIIHSVDSFHLAEAVSRRAAKTIPVFLEVNVTGEPNKFGLSPHELDRNLAAIEMLPNLDVLGLMTVAPQFEQPEQARPIFRTLRELAGSLGLKELSMGMSDDFEQAVQEGATHVRIGRAIFGERPR